MLKIFKRNIVIIILLLSFFFAITESPIIALGEGIDESTMTLQEQSEYMSTLLLELEVLNDAITENILQIKEFNENIINSSSVQIEELSTLLLELEVLNTYLLDISDSEILYEYDDNNRLINIISKFTGQVIYHFEYDQNGNLLKIIKY